MNSWGSIKKNKKKKTVRKLLSNNKLVCISIYIIFL